MTDTHPHDARAIASAAPGKVRIWDPLVRVFHWSLVVFFAVAWLSADELDDLHEIAGYVVAGLVTVRLVWGLVGSRYARFSQFVKGPQAVFSYLGDMARGKERRYLGHNPAGAAMIVALLLALSGTTVSGWLLAEPDRIAMLPDLPQIVAPAWADDDGTYGEDIEDAIEDLHEFLANLMLLLVGLHVLGVVLASFRHHENLARAMVTGDKRAAGPGDIARPDHPPGA